MCPVMKTAYDYDNDNTSHASLSLLSQVKKMTTDSTLLTKILYYSALLESPLACKCRMQFPKNQNVTTIFVTDLSHRK